MYKEDERYGKMREFSRVDAYIPFEARIVLPENWPNIRAKITGETVLAGFQSLPEIEDKQLSDWMNMLNTKLDTIINLLTFQRDGFCSLPFSRVNISGGGMSFSSRENYKTGDILEFKIMLPMLPPVALYIYGEVVTVEKQIENYHVAVKFIAMDDEIRDEIVKFVFKTQREILREKRR